MKTQDPNRNKKPVPQIWYSEMVNELATTYWQARNRPQMQQDRIDYCIKNNLEGETWGSTNQFFTPIAKLYQFLADAKAVDVEKLKNDWQDYKAKHYPVKGWKGDLRAAKIEAELKKLKNPKFTDTNYNYYSILINRYYLNNKQSEDLMEHFLNINIL